MPEASRNGRSVPASASPIVSTAARSAAAEAAGLAKSCLLARWMTASASSAPARMLVEVVEVAAADAGPLGLECGGGGVGPGQADDLVPGG